MSRYVSIIIQPTPTLVAQYLAYPWGPSGAAAQSADAVRADPRGAGAGGPAPLAISFDRTSFASWDELSTLAPAQFNPGAEALVGSTRYVCAGQWRAERRPGETASLR